MSTSSIAQQAELRKLLQRNHTLNGGILFGLDGHIVELQARAMEVLKRPDTWTNATRVSGMTGRAVDEAVERISGAFAKFDVPAPQVTILVNLAPADLPKVGTWLDLPLAIIMLQAAGILPDLPDHTEGDFILMGELSLHGEVRRVPGALSIAFMAKSGQTLIVPAGNEKECALILAKPGHERCRVSSVSSLDEVIDFFRGKRKLENALREEIRFESAISKAPDFGCIRGQAKAKEGAIIAAAGGHNLLLIGPPGEGKSLLASAIPGILPRLNSSEKVELTKIYSAYGALQNDGQAVTRRPMRNVHSSASKQALIGGGSDIPRPGEVTLAHLGVLFLDEIAEFSRGTLEALRDPIENGVITISRVRATLSFPCRFTLVAAMNPCPCGYYGSELCSCKERDVLSYQKKLSGPLLDRLDLQVELLRLSTDERFAETATDESPRIRARVEHARARQAERFANMEIPFNAAMPTGKLRELCEFSSDGFAAYKQLIDEHVLSTRSVDRLAKVARTVADLADSEQIGAEHVQSAATFVIGGLLRASF